MEKKLEKESARVRANIITDSFKFHYRNARNAAVSSSSLCSLWADTGDSMVEQAVIFSFYF